MRASSIAGRAALAGLAIVLPACGWFDPRDAGEGTGGGGVWIPPTTPEIVVQNLEAALEGGVFGDYVRAFTEEFRFTPDSADSIQLAIERPGEPVYEDWTREVETQVAEAVVIGAESVALSLTFLEEQVVAEGRLHKYAYTLTVTSASGATHYQGEAWFVIQQIGAEWLIRSWQDVITEDTVESWGRLKGRNRQI